MLLLKAFALVIFHFFSTAAFDEIDVRVLFLFRTKADRFGKHASNPKNISHNEAGGKLKLVKDRQL